MPPYCETHQRYWQHIHEEMGSPLMCAECWLDALQRKHGKSKPSPSFGPAVEKAAEWVEVRTPPEDWVDSTDEYHTLVLLRDVLVEIGRLR